MINIRDNTVSAEKQMKNSSLVYHLGNPEAKTKILIVGNSITRHGPNTEIGWNRDWGMAASAPEKDYVHRLFAMLTENGQDVFMRVSQCSFWERNYRNDDVLSRYIEERAFNADVVIFRLGENILEEDKPYFKESLKKFIAYICPLTGKTLFTTCFWRNPVVDEVIKSVAAERGEVCIDGNLSKEEENMALGQFEHSGVAIHPSDKGMDEIAKAIFQGLQKANCGFKV